MGLIGAVTCSGCGYRSAGILLGAHGEPYDLALGVCSRCREIVGFDPDHTFCSRCGDAVSRTGLGENGEIGCPRCGDEARLEEDDNAWH
jgi:hypothetical protein